MFISRFLPQVSLLFLRSTQTKATSFTLKRHGSTSASPWWTSLRNASGYQKSCSRECWRGKAETMISLAVPAPPKNPPTHKFCWTLTSIQTLCPAVDYSCTRNRLSPVLLRYIFTYGHPPSPRLRMLNLRLPLLQLTDLHVHPRPWDQIHEALQKACRGCPPDVWIID